MASPRPAAPSSPHEGNDIPELLASNGYIVAQAVAAIRARRPDATRFARIHRRAIVNLEAVTEVRMLPHGDREVILRDGVRLPVGRSFRDRFLAASTGRVPNP